jgi:hypothetical protein
MIKIIQETSYSDKAYWMNKYGKLIDVINVPERKGGDFSDKHIGAILRDPEIFGLSEDYIKEVYEKYGESISHEGKAREEIMINVIESGWVRIRYYHSKSYWTIQCGKFDKNTKENIWAFLNSDNVNPDDFTYISNTANEILVEPNRASVVSKNIYTESKVKVEIVNPKSLYRR